MSSHNSLDQLNNSSNSPEEYDRIVQEREFLLKAQETLSQIENAQKKLEIEKRNIWLSSPFLIAIATSMLSLATTVISGLSDSYSGVQLERQKFEFSLIEKSLTMEDGFLVSNEEQEREEAAKRLLFLVEIGVIKLLDADAISDKASNRPEEIPLRSSRTNYYCGTSNGYPATIGRNPGGKEIVLIEWRGATGGYSPEPRCLITSEKFDQYFGREGLRYIVAGTQNGMSVLCASNEPPTQTFEDCQNVILTLSPEKDVTSTVRHLTQLGSLNNIGPLIL